MPTKKIDKEIVQKDIAKDKPVESEKASGKPLIEKAEERREDATAIGKNLHMSLKHGMFIGYFIKGKSIDGAISLLEKVSSLRVAVPFRGEIPHRRGMMSGRYPVNASKVFIKLLKGLKGNCIANGLDLEKTRISYSCVSWASRPLKSGGRHMKRTNLVLKAREFKGMKNG